MAYDEVVRKLHSTDDAVIWADEFCRINPGMMQHDVMIGWFANAIEIGKTYGRKEVIQLITDHYGGVISKPWWVK